MEKHQPLTLSLECTMQFLRYKKYLIWLEIQLLEYLKGKEIPVNPAVEGKKEKPKGETK